MGKESLTIGDRTLLNKALSKRIADLTDSDKAVIRAREAYLSAFEYEAFKKILVEEIVLMDLNKTKLEKMCTEKGIDFKDAKNKADLVALLEAVEEK